MAGVVARGGLSPLGSILADFLPVMTCMFRNANSLYCRLCFIFLWDDGLGKERWALRAGFEGSTIR